MNYLDLIMVINIRAYYFNKFQLKFYTNAIKLTRKLTNFKCMSIYFNNNIVVRKIYLPLKHIYLSIQQTHALYIFSFFFVAYLMFIKTINQRLCN